MKSEILPRNKSIFVLSMLFASMTFFLWQSDFSDEIRERAVAPVEFHFRTFLKKDPEFSNKLKVVVYGDKAKREFGAQETITLKQWQNFIEALASRRPRAIVFDKFFGSVIGSTEDIESFNTALKNFEMPVIAGAAFGGLDDPENKVEPAQLNTWNIDTTQEIPEGHLSTLIGPARPIRSAFKKLGSIRYVDGASIEPAWQDAETRAILPHLSLSFLPHVRWTHGKIFSDDWALFLNKKGLVPVNFVRRDEAFSKFIPAAQIIRLGKKAPSLEKIAPGDVVLILPSMYAGSTDFKKTPVGRIEGGFFHIAIINSVLTNTPIHPILQSAPLMAAVLFAFSLLTTFCSLRLRIRTAIILLSTLTVVLGVSGLFGFALSGLQWDWHLLSGLVLCNGIMLLTLRTIRDERQSERIESALAGMVSAQVLNKIKKNPENFYQRPNQLRVAVMFIDIEGFSLRTGNHLPADIFTVLHAQIERMSNIVHAHGGIVDRILGDGLLCYFGHSFGNSNTSTSSSENNTYQALRCAIEIQREAARLTAETRHNTDDLSGLLPLRIGLNTGEVFLGNLGSGSRIDLTIIGNHVNLAKRLEDACETFRIMLSNDAYMELERAQLISKYSDVRFEKRLLNVKHKDELITGWECDPHVSQYDYVEIANKKLSKIRPEILNHPHVTFNKHHIVCVDDDANAKLARFKDKLFLLSSTNYYCRKVFLPLHLSKPPISAMNPGEKSESGILYVQVLAGTAIGEKSYVHVVKPVHITAQQVNDLLTSL